MITPVLTIAQRHDVETGPWFPKLAPAPPRAVLERAAVRRLPDAASLAVRAEPGRRLVSSREKSLARAGRIADK